MSNKTAFAAGVVTGIAAVTATLFATGFYFAHSANKTLEKVFADLKDETRAPAPAVEPDVAGAEA